MHASTRLPAVLAGLGLLPPVAGATSGLHALLPTADAGSCLAAPTGSDVG
jgi:hypothetical protein